MMKKIFILMVATVAMISAASCQKTVVNNTAAGDGILSFYGFSLELDEEVETKASAASGSYVVIIYDAEANEIIRRTYSEIKNNDNKMSLPAGNYTLLARSTDEEVPMAEFEQPVYTATHDFTIEVGKETQLGELVCTLAQCKVTVSYSDDFIDALSGGGSTKVTVTAGYPLEYKINENGTYDQSAGYFAVNGNTMEVVFTGNIGGKTQKMTKTFTNIAARQWRQVKFINKTNEQGGATFDIVINDLVSDEVLNEDLVAEEVIIGEDPDAPQDDGGILLALSEDCDPSITYTEENIIYDADGNKINSVGVIDIPIVPIPDGGSEPTMAIKFNAVVPGGLAEFTVDIATDNPDFAGAVEAAGATHIDLINPTCSPVIFDLVPFPHGSEILGKTNIALDLSNAQQAISGFHGTHLFTIVMTDADGKTKHTKVTMRVE